MSAKQNPESDQVDRQTDGLTGKVFRPYDVYVSVLGSEMQWGHSVWVRWFRFQHGCTHVTAEQELDHLNTQAHTHLYIQDMEPIILTDKQVCVCVSPSAYNLLQKLSKLQNVVSAEESVWKCLLCLLTANE